LQESRTLFEKLKEPEKRILDHINTNPGTSNTINGLNQSRKIDNISRNITINQRFMFIKELFKGNPEEFNEAVERLENCRSYDEAYDLLSQSYIQKNQWNMETEEVSEFLSLVSKRFN
jgi:hypothetical protein